MSERPKAPLEELTESQRERLRKLREEILLDKITISFSIDDRDPSGRRRSAFYSVNVARSSEEAAGWSLDEIRAVRALVSAHVVAATYDDAFRRKVLPFNEETKAERNAIVANYEKLVVGHLGSGVSKGPNDPSEGGSSNA